MLIVVMSLMTKMGSVVSSSSLFLYVGFDEYPVPSFLIDLVV